jgi:hypothetical protein
MFLNSAIVAKTFYCRVEDFSGRLLVRIHNARSLILLTFGSFLALNLDHTTHHPSHYIIPPIKSIPPPITAPSHSRLFFKSTSIAKV